MAKPEDERIKPKRVCSTKGCNRKIGNAKRVGKFIYTTCATCLRRAGGNKFNKLPLAFKKTDWRDIVRDSNNDDALLRRRVQMYYDNLRIGQFIQNIRIDKKTKTIKIKIPRNKAGLFIGRRSSIKSNLERLVKHTVEIIA